MHLLSLSICRMLESPWSDAEGNNQRAHRADTAFITCFHDALIIDAPPVLFFKHQSRSNANTIEDTIPLLAVGSVGLHCCWGWVRFQWSVLCFLCFVKRWLTQHQCNFFTLMSCYCCIFFKSIPLLYSMCHYWVILTIEVKSEHGKCSLYSINTLQTLNVDNCICITLLTDTLYLCPESYLEAWSYEYLMC